MKKKITAFISALLVSAVSVGSLAAFAATDWIEHDFESAKLQVTDYNGTIQLKVDGATTTMSVETTYATNYKYLSVIPHSYDDTSETYTELSNYATDVEGTAKILATAAKSMSNVDYICSVGTLCNTSQPQAGTYKTLVVHVVKDADWPQPDRYL